MAEESTISRRKDEHLDLVEQGLGQGGDASTWLEYVKLVPTSLPELAISDVSTSVELWGRRFAAPLMVSGMTGGTTRAMEVNYALAQAAEALGIPFGIGSQRIMLEDEATAATFDVKTVAPNLFLLGNIGGVQLARIPIDRTQWLVRRVRADALCVHLNPLQELAQPEGEREFVGVLAAIREAVQSLDVPLVVKEVGAGIGLETALRLKEAGVEYVDVAGFGGTSFVRIEALRAEDQRLLLLEDLCIPTAAAVVECTRARLTTIASGGVRTGLDIAKCLALGAKMCSVAGPVLKAYCDSGYDGVIACLSHLIYELRLVMGACGCRRPEELLWTPRLLLGPLKDWVSQR